MCEQIPVLLARQLLLYRDVAGRGNFYSERFWNIWCIASHPRVLRTESRPCASLCFIARTNSKITMGHSSREKVS